MEAVPDPLQKGTTGEEGRPPPVEANELRTERYSGLRRAGCRTQRGVGTEKSPRTPKKLRLGSTRFFVVDSQSGPERSSVLYGCWRDGNAKAVAPVLVAVTGSEPCVRVPPAAYDALMHVKVGQCLES
jgi:hypothetical protein